MKKLKIILPILLISLLFIVPRETLAATNQVNALYNSDYLSEFNYFSNNTPLVNNVRETINNNLETINNYDTHLNLLNDENVVFYDFQQTTKKVVAHFVYSVTLNFSSATSITIKPTVLQVEFSYDNDYNITSFRSMGSTIYTRNISNLDYIFDYYYGKNSNLMLYNNRFSTDILVGPNETPFLTGTSMSLYDFVQALDADIIPPSFEPVSCPLSFLGSFSNVSSFSLQIYGVSNALKPHLRGKFQIKGTGNDTFNTDDYIISVSSTDPNLIINEDIEGNYNFNCENYNCFLEYDYYYIDDIDTEINILFSFSSSSDILNYKYDIYSCNLNLDNSMSYGYINNISDNDNNTTNTSLENNINDTNVDGSNSFLQNNIINNSAFNQDHGITSVIQAPINFLQSLNNKTCSSIVLPLPHLGNATIPCMSTIYLSKFNELYNIIKVIINGVICYRLALSVVMIVKGAKNPNEDKIEVMDL